MLSKLRIKLIKSLKSCVAKKTLLKTIKINIELKKSLKIKNWITNNQIQDHLFRNNHNKFKIN
jgi:hypothetical protein